MEYLPSDVVVDILSRIPVESVLDCKLVSKRLLNLLSDRRDQFAKMHHQRQLLQLTSTGDALSSSTGLLFSFEKYEEDERIGVRLYYGNKYNDEMNIHEKFSYKTLQKTTVSCTAMRQSNVIVGSYNGLICLVRYHHGMPDPIHICNPITGEYVNLPEYTLTEEEHFAAFGFGYVHLANSDQYKVVRIYYPDSENYDKGEVQVYTIGIGSGWRAIGTTSYLLWLENCVGNYVNGSLHWIVDKKIVAFNLADEEFGLIQSPPCYDSSHDCSTCFDMVLELRGNLCLCHQNNKERLLDIWALKKNAAEASWSRDFSIAYNSGWEGEGGSEFQAMPILITKKNEVLFVHQGSTLYCYDPKNKYGDKTLG
ncbi:F-box protein At3g07870-like [Papaver somniferum]|uniref:F-box protein At3g07870-like n=1 Tax=Papaver somniferum TaxID=3469 RepID=UPI000E6F5187|nr:F-box protein At3g07870-like [Papaver somniferum]